MKCDDSDVNTREFCALAVAIDLFTLLYSACRDALQGFSPLVACAFAGWTEAKDAIITKITAMVAAISGPRIVERHAVKGSGI